MCNFHFAARLTPITLLATISILLTARTQVHRIALLGLAYLSGSYTPFSSTATFINTPDTENSPLTSQEEEDPDEEPEEPGKIVPPNLLY